MFFMLAAASICKYPKMYQDVVMDFFLHIIFHFYNRAVLFTRPSLYLGELSIVYGIVVNYGTITL